MSAENARTTTPDKFATTALDKAAFDTLRFEVNGHVGRLTLNRPEKLNSFTLEMWQEMRALGRMLLDEPGDVRALIVTGEGRAFSSGIDTSVFAGAFGDAVSVGTGLGTEPEAPLHDEPVAAMVLRTQQSYSWLADVPFATIAAIRGYAFGAGLQLALACDVRIVARTTKLGLLELQYGMIPDLGGTQRLPRLVGPGKAKEMIFTAARIDAQEAYRIGLVEQLVDDAELDATADAFAQDVASRPPLAIAGAKRAVRAASELPIADGLRVEAECQSRCLRSDDLREAMSAFVEQRTPEYRNR